jgi:PEGA domain
MATSPDPLTNGASDADTVEAAVTHISNPLDRGCSEEIEESALGRLHFDATHRAVAHDAGAPESLFFDETALDASPARLGVTVTWPLLPAGKLGGTRAAARDAAAQAAHGLMSQQKTCSSVSESQRPLFGADFASADLATFMMVVFQRSHQLYPRASRREHRQASIIAPLLAAAAAGARVRLAAFRRTIATRASEVLERARALGRQAARFCRPAGRVAFAGMSSVLGMRISRTGVRRVSWAAAGLGLASVIYTGWAATAPTNGAVAPPVAAANPMELRSAAVTPPETRQRASVPDTDARPFSGGRKAARSRAPARSTTSARTSAKPLPVKPAPLGRGYVGSLVVTSDPRGAEVSVDGVPRGSTPVTIRALNAGSRVIRVTMPGHQPWSWSVAVVADKETPVAVKLRPTSPPQLPPVRRSAGIAWP